MDEGIGLTTLQVKDEVCRDSVNAAESVGDILIANDQWKSGAVAFEKPLHALAADTDTPILEPVDGDVLLFLHADSVIPAGGLAPIARALCAFG